jgi:hypothetical protein
MTGRDVPVEVWFKKSYLSGRGRWKSLVRRGGSEFYTKYESHYNDNVWFMVHIGSRQLAQSSSS